MANKTIANPKKAAEAAMKARDEAIKAHEEAQEAYELAKAKQAEIEERIATGGAVSREEHDDALFDVKVAAGRVWSTEKAKTEAEHEAQVKTAIATADVLINGKASRVVLYEAVESAKADVTNAIQSLVGKARHRNRAIDEAVAAGKDAGLQEGLVDPASPVLLIKKTHPGQPWRKAHGHTLIINGEEEEQVDLTELVTSTVLSAAHSAGVEIKLEEGGRK